jgi:hypothetical protein
MGAHSGLAFRLVPGTLACEGVLMEYRGIRYPIRARIEREQWSVAILPAGVEKAAKVTTGSRGKAEQQAHSLINTWLEKQPAPKR